MKNLIIISIFLLGSTFTRAQNWSSTGDNATTGNIIAQNPNNASASAMFSWLNDVARIRIGGVGSGAVNGFVFQGTGDSNLLRILNNGNIGIGTTTPEEKLHIQGTITIVGDIGIPIASHWVTGNHTLELQNNDAGDVVLSFHRAGYTNAAIKHSPLGGLIFSGSGGYDANHVFLKSNGYMGIGTTSPLEMLHVSAGTSVDAILVLEADTDNSNEADNPGINFVQDGAEVNYFIEIEGNASTKSPNTVANALMIGTESNRDIHLISNDAIQMTVTPSGVGVGTIILGRISLPLKAKSELRRLKWRQAGPIMSLRKTITCPHWRKWKNISKKMDTSSIFPLPRKLRKMVFNSGR